MIERQLDSLFRAARTLPADKLDWKPAPGSRSALDQLQEVATSPDQFRAAHAERKMEWSEEKFVQWMAERGELTDLDQLERHAKESHARLFAEIRAMSEEDLELPVQMPFPGEWKVADIFAYYHYNASYHEGQITYIRTLLEQAQS
jgi:hypothetical protein